MKLKTIVIGGLLALGLAASTIVPDYVVKIEISERAASADDGAGGTD